MQHRVDAGAPAALVGARKQPEAKTGNGAEHGERGIVHPLGVLEMARGVVDDVALERSPGTRTRLGQQLADVAHPLRRTAPPARRRGGGRSP